MQKFYMICSSPECKFYAEDDSRVAGCPLCGRRVINSCPHCGDILRYPKQEFCTDGDCLKPLKSNKAQDTPQAG